MPGVVAQIFDWPVNEIQVDILKPELFHAAVECVVRWLMTLVGIP